MRFQLFCECCGLVPVPGERVRVKEALQLGWATYEFTCVRCGVLTTRSADQETLLMLRRGGAVVEPYGAPMEFLEPKPWPMFQVDDLIDAGLKLAAGQYISDFFLNTECDIPRT
jgi:hypothetical protein